MPNFRRFQTLTFHLTQDTFHQGFSQLCITTQCLDLILIIREFCAKLTKQLSLPTTSHNYEYRRPGCMIPEGEFEILSKCSLAFAKFNFQQICSTDQYRQSWEDDTLKSGGNSICWYIFFYLLMLCKYLLVLISISRQTCDIRLIWENLTMHIFHMML